MEAATLLGIEQIKQLKARYFYCVDYKDWEGWRSVFAADGELLAPELRDTPFTGIEEILDFFPAFLDGVKTIHHGHMPVIEIIDDRHAKGIWAMEDILFWPEGRPDGIPAGRVHGYGYYHEEYVKQSDGWRIQRLRLDRLHIGPL